MFTSAARAALLAVCLASTLAFTVAVPLTSRSTAVEAREPLVGGLVAPGLAYVVAKRDGDATDSGADSHTSGDSHDDDAHHDDSHHDDSPHDDSPHDDSPHDDSHHDDSHHDDSHHDDSHQDDSHHDGDHHDRGLEARRDDGSSSSGADNYDAGDSHHDDDSHHDHDSHHDDANDDDDHHDGHHHHHDDDHHDTRHDDHLRRRTLGHIQAREPIIGDASRYQQGLRRRHVGVEARERLAPQYWKRAAPSRELAARGYYYDFDM